MPMALHSGDDIPSLPSSSSSGIVRRVVNDILSWGQKSSSRSESLSSNIQLQWAKAYWDSIDSEKRERFLEISISDLKEHYSKSDNYATMINVLSHVQEQKAMKNYLCCECGKSASDSHSFLSHIRKDHMKNLPPNLHFELANQVSKGMADIIINGEWEPVAIEADDEEHPVSPKGQEREYVSQVQKRVDCIKTIRQKFWWLSENGCLSYSHLNEVIRFTKNENQGFSSSSQTPFEAFSLLPRSICSLDFIQLDKISTFLEEIENSCQGAEDIDCPPDEIEAERIIFPIEKTVSWDTTKISLNLSYVLDERLFYESHDSPDEPGICDAIFLSVFSGQDLYHEILAMKLSNGKKLLQLIQRKVNQLQADCIGKCRLSCYKRILMDVEKSIQEEGKKKESFQEYSTVSYKSLVSERLKKYRLVTPVPENCPSEVEVLSDILKEARNCNSHDFDWDNMSVGTKDPMIAWDSLDINDEIIACAIQRIKNEITLKVCKIDARFLQTMISKGLYEIKLGRILAFDLRLTLLPYMKFFMRSQLKALGKKHAIEKAYAAGEALLKEEASKKKDNVKGSSKKPGTTQGKTKNKKKKKRQQKTEGRESTQLEDVQSHSEEKQGDTENGHHCPIELPESQNSEASQSLHEIPMEDKTLQKGEAENGHHCFIELPESHSWEASQSLQENPTEDQTLQMGETENGHHCFIELLESQSWEASQSLQEIPTEDQTLQNGSVTIFISSLDVPLN